MRAAATIHRSAGTQFDQADQAEQVPVLNHVNFVEDHHHGRDANLPAEQAVVPVSGIVTSAAESSSTDPSSGLAPVIMFL